MKVNWLMYKDGAAIDQTFGLNKTSIKYTFKEPGKYTMMYYIISGDEVKQFYNFPEVEYLNEVLM